MLTINDLTVDGRSPVTLNLSRGELLGLVARSGSGALELLEALGGRRTANKGLACTEGHPVAGPGFGSIQRDAAPHPDPKWVGLATSSDVLLPHLDVTSNVALPLRIIGLNGHEARAQAAETIAWLGLDSVAHARPAALSLAQVVRTRVARALSCRPKLLLLHDLCAGLSPSARAEVVGRLRRLLLARELTAIFATPEVDEALGFGTQIGLIDEGGLQQVGGPAEVLDSPRSAAVARAFGRANVLHGQVCDLDDELVEVRLACGSIIEAVRGNEATRTVWNPGSPCEIAIRPGRLAVAFMDHLPAEPETGDLPAHLLDAQLIGEQLRLRFKLRDGTEIIAHRPPQSFRGRLERDRPALLACRANDAIAFSQA